MRRLGAPGFSPSGSHRNWEWCEYTFVPSVGSAARGSTLLSWTDI